MIRAFLATVGVASGMFLMAAGPVWAHIDPAPPAARAGSRITVGFTVEHGCDGSPTTQLDMRLPEGVGDPVPEDVDGWVGSVADIDGDTIVTFAGGPLADDAIGTFEVTMTLPSTPDTTIHFPFVQRCEVGDIRWIGIPAEPGDELDEPAPAMALTGPVEAATPTSAETRVPTTAETEPTPAIEPAVEPAATSATSEPAVISAGVDEPAASGTGTAAFVLSVAAVLAIGGFVYYRSRQARAEFASRND